MTWLWLVLGAWIGLNVLYVVVRLIVTSPERQALDKDGSAGTAPAAKRSDVHFVSFGR